MHYLPDRATACLRRNTQYRSSEDCPICILVDELRKSDNIDNIEKAKNFSAKVKYFMYIVDLDDIEAGVQIFGAGIKIMQQLIPYLLDTDWGDFTDLQRGYDVIIERKGTDRTTQYFVRLKKTPSSFPYLELLENIQPLGNVIPVMSASEIKEHLLQSGLIASIQQITQHEHTVLHKPEISTPTVDKQTDVTTPQYEVDSNVQQKPTSAPDIQQSSVKPSIDQQQPNVDELIQKIRKKLGIQ